MILLMVPMMKSTWPDSGQILRHQYGISLAELQSSSTLRNVPRGGEQGGTAVFTNYSFHSFGFIFEKQNGLLNKSK